MSFELNLSQKISQTLKISQQLQQAIKLLSLTTTELQQEIEQFCLTNPLLEFRKESADETEIKEIDDNRESSPSYSSGAVTTEGNPDEWTAKPKDLVEELVEQIGYNNLDFNEKVILYNLIGNLDRRGYLAVDPQQLATAHNWQVSTVEKMLNLLKSLEPAGIAASSLSECLLLQLERRGLQDSLAGKIVVGFLNELGAKKYKFIMQALNCSAEQVQEAAAIIQNLNPEPLAEYNLENERLVIPELQLITDGKGWKIMLSDDLLQKLSFSPVYMELMSNNKFNSKSDRSYFNKKFKEANWLIRSIVQRNSTLLKVAECIFSKQRDFIHAGPAAIKPLILADVAKEIEVHESTVSRAVNEKYIATPRGVLPLKFFFSSKVGDSQSAVALREMIREMIASENHNEPLSDQEICDLMSNKNMTLARRTVAKYREELKIPSARERKH